MAWLTLAMPAAVPCKLKPIISSADESSTTRLQVSSISTWGINEELVSWSLILFTLRSLIGQKKNVQNFTLWTRCKLWLRPFIYMLCYMVLTCNPGIYHFVTSHKGSSQVALAEWNIYWFLEVVYVLILWGGCNRMVKYCVLCDEHNNPGQLH